MLPEQPAQELLDAAVLADGLGYHACYSADEIYHKDAWLLFAALTGRTQRIRLGPCVAPVYMREPTYVAQLAATLDELSDGRAEVVFGIGNIAMLEQYGVEWRGTRPIGRLREAHQIMRTFLDEGTIDFEGDFYSYSGVTTAARPVQEHLPLKIGAMGGPKSMELAGEIADGLHTACAYSPEALGYAVEHFRAGMERAGRSPDGLDLGDSLLGAIAPDREVARRAGRILAAFYIPSMPPALLERHGIEPERVLPVNEAFAAGDVQGALEATPEEVADRLMVAGTPEDWVVWLRDRYLPAGLDHALISFTDPFTLRAWAGIEVEGLPKLGEQVRLVGEQVIPELPTP
ncbi:MAG TPA: LLM class flavin-dependent oxidoreductase [Solirubrobacterales bacterium]|nr:LLM class flavin-dependent oxidoreductase [Solirubrobacterales bacterium]